MMLISRTLTAHRRSWLLETATQATPASYTASSSYTALLQGCLKEALDAEDIEWKRAERYWQRLYYIQDWCREALQGMRDPIKLLKWLTLHAQDVSIGANETRKEESQ
jgi:hypothetical protein